MENDKQKIEEVLTRGVEEIFVKDHLEKTLLEGKKLRIKFGIDPTSPAIHLGRTIPLIKLKALQDLGHQIILIIGDFTAKIADPSDKLEKRPMLTDEEIKNNLKDYLRQIGMIIDLKKTEVHYNSEWFAGMGYIELGQLLECFSLQQMLRRRNFKERMKNDQDIFVVELIYPALQGYDSFKVNADLEIGGFDQLFNLKAGRVVQRKYGQKEQDIMTVSMLLGTDGRKMSSSWGNVISLLDPAEDMFGKIMAIRDDLILKYFTLCTKIPLSKIINIEERLNSGVNPRDIKIELAFEIVRMYHGEVEAEKAQQNFEQTFSKGEFPENAEVLEVEKTSKLGDALVASGVVDSKSEWRRLVEQGAVSDYPDQKITDPNEVLGESTRKLRVGKKTFLIIKPN